MYSGSLMQEPNQLVVEVMMTDGKQNKKIKMSFLLSCCLTQKKKIKKKKMYGCPEEKRGLWMTNKAVYTEWFVMEVLMTMLLKGYFWVVFSFSLTPTPLCSHQCIHFVSYYLTLFQQNLECSCNIQQIKGWQNHITMKKIMREKETYMATSKAKGVKSAQQDFGWNGPGFLDLAVVFRLSPENKQDEGKCMLLNTHNKQTYRHMRPCLFMFSLITYFKSCGSPLLSELCVFKTQLTIKGKW